MDTDITPELEEVMEAVHSRPAVCVFMPFDPKMGLKKELTHSLKTAADKVERELLKAYPAEMTRLITEKLRGIIHKLELNTHKKSIVIYVSPVFEKVLYLDVAVEEKIIVDESFEIRDLVYSKKQLNKYLVLLLSGSESRTYLVDANSFIRILSNTPEKVSAYINDAPEKVANFSDMSSRKEITMDKFLRHIDNSLDTILKSYQLPLFVLGTERILGHFKSFTKHGKTVVEYVQGNYEETTLPDLKKILEPYVADWKKAMQKDLLNQIENAADKKKLAIGMRKVWREAMKENGRLLVVEKNFLYPARRGNHEDKFSYIHDAVDDVIEKVLEHGGDVEFVDHDLLKDYRQIALVLF